MRSSNLQSDFSPLDAAQLALGARLRASWKALSLFYSAYVNALGFRSRPVSCRPSTSRSGACVACRCSSTWRRNVGLLRADVSGAGSGQDYYHFASYFRLRFYLTDLAYVQYRQGLRTFDNRRGVIVDDTRLTREDGSTHNFGDRDCGMGRSPLGCTTSSTSRRRTRCATTSCAYPGVYEF